MYLKYFSKVSPSFSNKVTKKIGSVEMMRKSIAISLGINFLINKYTGIPTNPASVNPISCLLVRLNATFVFTFFKSLGIGT